MERRTFWLLSAAIVLLAFVLREMYVLQAVLWKPFGGDAGAYVRYALNMQRGYFGEDDVPDAYRPPGYPALIALSQLLGGDSYSRLLQWQAVMGAATVGFTISLGRQWLPAWAALLAGLLLAVWPHHIAFTAEVLTEVFFGFLLSAAMLVAALAKDRAWIWGCAGGLFALATLTNSIALFVPLIAGVSLIGRSPARWVAFLVPMLVIVGGWSLRPVDGGSDRIWQNLVQGSHPRYHEAFKGQFSEPAMAAQTKAINAEIAALLEDKPSGLRKMAERLAEQPLHSAAWYASKAWLLWDWEVRVTFAKGAFYVRPVTGSTLEANPLRSVVAVTWLLNSALFAAALLFALYAALRPGPTRMLALTFLYVTAVHVVLQAEPRYSTPYRFVELLLAVSALAAGVKSWGRVRQA